VSQKEDKTK